MLEAWIEARAKTQHLEQAVDVFTHEELIRQQREREVTITEIQQTGDSLHYGGFFRIMNNHLGTNVNSLDIHERAMLLSAVKDLSKAFGPNGVTGMFRTWQNGQASLSQK